MFKISQTTWMALTTCISAACVTVPAAHAKTFFVNNTGSMTNALESASNGDTIVITSNFTSNQTFLVADGVTIDGLSHTVFFDPPSDAPDALPPLFLVRDDNVTLKNLILESDGLVRNDAFVLLDNTGTFTANDFVAENVTFSDATRGILSVGGIPVNMRVEFCTFSNLSRAGLDIIRDLAAQAPANRIFGVSSSIGLSDVTGFFSDAGTYLIANNTFSGVSQTNINIDAGNDAFEPLNATIPGVTPLLDVPGFPGNTPTNRPGFDNVVVYFSGKLTIDNNNGLLATEFPIAVARTANVQISFNSVTTVSGSTPAAFASGINAENDAANVTINNNVINVQSEELNSQGISLQAFNDHGRVLNINTGPKNVTIESNIIFGRGTNAMFIQGALGTIINNNDLDGAFGLPAFESEFGPAAANISIFGFPAAEVPNPATGGSPPTISQAAAASTFAVQAANPGAIFISTVPITTTSGLVESPAFFTPDVLVDGSPQATEGSVISSFQFN